MKETKLSKLVTGTEMKPLLTRNMWPNINTCKNGWLNFSANLTVVSLKLLKLTQYTWPNLSIYINFLCAVPRDDVIESTRFLMRPPVNHSTMMHGICHTPACIPPTIYNSVNCKHFSLVLGCEREEHDGNADYQMKLKFHIT